VRQLVELCTACHLAYQLLAGHLSFRVVAGDPAPVQEDEVVSDRESVMWVVVMKITRLRGRVPGGCT